jgi:Uma2 family endonuclease
LFVKRSWALRRVADPLVPATAAIVVDSGTLFAAEIELCGPMALEWQLADGHSDPQLPAAKKQEHPDAMTSRFALTSSHPQHGAHRNRLDAQRQSRLEWTPGRVGIGGVAGPGTMATTFQDASTGQRLLTIADVAALPDELPTGPVEYELDNGRLVVMSPTGRSHGEIQLHFGSILRTHVKQQGLGIVTVETGFVLWRNPDRLVAPDIAFVPMGAAGIQESREGFIESIPSLVVEVRSRNDVRPALLAKVADCLTAGVGAVLTVDPKSEIVTIHRANQPETTLGISDTLRLDDILPGFELPLQSLFRP